jgi:hypothetical protein
MLALISKNIVLAMGHIEKRGIEKSNKNIA